MRRKICQRRGWNPAGLIGSGAGCIRNGFRLRLVSVHQAIPYLIDAGAEWRDPSRAGDVSAHIEEAFRITIEALVPPNPNEFETVMLSDSDAMGSRTMFKSIPSSVRVK